MCCECCSVTQRKLWVFGLGTFFALLGIGLAVFWPALSKKLVYKNLVIKPGTESYNSWVEAPIPIYLEVSLFNWTNSDQVRDHNIKPRFVEMGPYVFLEKHLKQDLDFHDNDTVSYYEARTWFFDEEKSNGTLDDLVTSAHVISATVAEAMSTSNIFIKMVINHMLNREGGALTVTKPVREWIFDGFDDKLIDFLKRFNTSKINIPYDKFGWLVERNGSKTYEGRFTIETGVTDISKLGILTHWNGRTETGFYPGECGKINGTSGDLFPPALDTENDITIFATDACRFLNLEPSGPLHRHGLEGVTFKANARSMGGVEYPEQQCFCPPGKECPKSGMLEVSKCRDDAPIYTSYPHFYLADSSYLEAVEGMHPQAEKHQFEMSVEPITGVPLEVHGRLQINMMMTPYDDFDIFRGVQPFMMPLFWFANIAELDEPNAKKAKLAINLSSYGSYFAYAMCGLGGLLIAVGIVLTISKSWKRIPADDREPLSET